MGVGHAAVAIAALRIAPRMNAGLLIFAAFFADFLLGIFAALGLEQAHVPPEYPSRHYLTFTFPYSHGLMYLILWAVLLGILLCWFDPRDRRGAFLVIAALVVSHFLLDGLVHIAGLPLAGPDSPRFGLGLWRHLPLELSLETVMTFAGLALFWGLATSRTRWTMALVMLVLAALTWSQLWMTAAPTSAELIPNWIAGPVVFAAIPYVIDRKRAKTAAA